MKKLFVFIFGLGLLTLVQSCGLLSAAGLSKQGLSAKEAPADLSEANSVSAVVVDHSAWTALLQKHVNPAGFVNYKGFIADKSALDSYCEYISSFAPDDSWSIQEQLAFYINLYNAYTVKLIVDNYPTKSIKDLDGPWTKAFVPIGNKMISLGGIENSLLRKMNEPRIHFAINCASYSCPKLLDEAFDGNRIDAQLERVTSDFINGDKNDIKADNASVSQLFNWYKGDYLTNGITTVTAYINQYSDVKIDAQVALTFKEYDWALNEQ
ncbi:MAG: DUF547 domain-containing protein [Gilvibacter sp.]